MRCSGSDIVRHVSDYQSVFRSAPCPVCGTKVKITIPDRKWHCNTARFSKHSAPKEDNGKAQ
jgi:phage/plasmid primase-like uncharacterized protein